MTRIPDPSTHRHDQDEAAQIRELLKLCVWSTWTGAALTWLLVIWPASQAMPIGLPLPLPLHAGLIVVPAVIVLAFDRCLARPPRLTLPSIVLLVASSAGIELFGTLTQIGTTLAASFAADEPDPIRAFLTTVVGPDVLLNAMLFVILANATATSLTCRRLVRIGPLATLPTRILLLYSLVRLHLGFAQPLGQPNPTPTIMAGLAIALLAGLGIAFLLDRFRPQPESLPQAPRS